MEYKYPLTAINRDRSTVMLYTVDEVRKFVVKNGWWGEHWEKHWFWYDYGKRNPHPSVPYYWTCRDVPVNYSWIIRDDWGCVVKPTNFDFTKNTWRENRLKVVRHAEALGLPIPGQRHAHSGWKANAPAMKNSGKGKRNRDRALCEYEFQEYGVKNKYGMVQPWEGY
jgi:hypothetical protein